MSRPRVCFVQQNFAVGDIDGNRQKLQDAAALAHQQKADVILASELAVSGYCPNDMLYDRAFLDAAANAVQQLATETADLPPFVLGAPLLEDGRLYNAAALLQGGKISWYKKEWLPNDSVFDEKRYFADGDNPPLLLEAGGAKFAVQICADMWYESQAARVRESGAQYVLLPNASPFYLGKHAARLVAAKNFVAESGAGIFYCNTVGGQDELIFDGASFMMDAQGTVCRQLPPFICATECVTDVADDTKNESPYPDDEQAIYDGLLLGVRDYVTKNGFRGVLLGLSGGIDSALTAVLAADALGGENVLLVMMPSRYTSAASLQDAAELAKNIGAEYITIPIDPLMDSVGGALQPHLQPREDDVTMENVQARLRGQLLMALSNNRGLLLLATGNKSELACGYATLYGDMCGGFAPLKDVSKTRVWALSAFRNRRSQIIPSRVITRAPSAELRDGQTDQQTLPPYATIDAAITSYIENGASRQTVAEDLGADFARHFFSLLTAGEHKRQQGAIGPKITARAFGRDWRMPVANRFRDVPS